MRLLDEKNNCRDHFVQKANPQPRPYIRLGQKVMLLVVAPTSCRKKTFEVVKTGSDSVAVLLLCTLAHLSVSFSVRET